MRKSLRASILVLALAFSAHAGEIPNPPVVPPPPPQQVVQEVTTEHDMDTLPLVQIVLNLLALF